MRRIGFLFGLACLAGCGGSGGPKEWVPPTHIPINPVSFDAQAVAEDPAAFPLMVMAGDPRPDSMLLWTRVATADTVRLRVWLPGIDPDDPDRVDMLIDKPVTPDAHGFVHERVAVIPGRFHAYAFFTGADPDSPTGRSPIGRFTAAPPDGALVRLTVSGTHGTHQRESPYPTLTANAAFEPYTLYLHLGDSIYSDSAREQTPAACTLNEYLAYWDDNWQTEGFRAALAEAVYLPVPDDHEVANNYDAEFDDPDCPGRVANGHQAYFLENPIEPGPLYRSWRWGDTVEFFMLDCRSERRPSTADDPSADPPTISPDPVYLSAEQMAWFTQALADSTATFKLVLNSVPLASFPNPPWLNMDRCDTWTCYTRQREQLIKSITDRGIENVFFVSGDFHMAMVGRLDPPGGVGHGLFEFFIGPGAQSNPLADREFIIEQLGEEYDPLPPDQFLWGFPSPTMTYVDLDPLAKPPELTLRYYDVDGSELYRVTFVGGEPVTGP